MRPEQATIKLIRKWTMKLCSACHEHRAISVYRGFWKFRRDHPLCQRCYEAACDRDRARLAA